MSTNTIIENKPWIFILLFFILSISITAQKKGKASYYADKFEGKKTASGEIYQHKLKTAAHRTLPFGTLVKVTNLDNNKSVIVKINDRGPFSKNRIIDLSKSAVIELDAIKKGIINVAIKKVKNK